MRKIWLYLCMMTFIQLVVAADSLWVSQPQVPILIDRQDNVLFEMSLKADKGENLNKLIVNFDDPSDISAIKSLKLYYAGTEGAARQGSFIRPVEYVSAHERGKTRAANASYSVLQSEITKLGKKVVFENKQPLMKGVNYFWISIEMYPKASLLSKVTARITGAELAHQPLVLAGRLDNFVRRVGYGVRHAGDDGVAAFRIPGLVTTNKGTLLGVYDVRYNSSYDLQEKVDIGISRSTDKGQSWEPMRIALTFGETGGLPHAQNGVGDPSILVDKKTNTIWVVAAWTHGLGNQRAWHNSMPGMTMNETAQLVMAKSEDDGKTWSKPINITSMVKDPSWYFLLQGPGRGISMKDGTLVFPIQYIDSNRIPNAGIMYSKDHGKTWKINNKARTKTTESQVAEVEPGVLMLNMRDDRGGSRAVSVTRDLGKTWTEHVSNRKALQEPVCMASLIHVDAQDNIMGKDLLIFSNPNTTKGRHHITIKVSIDGGKTWPEPYQLMLDEGAGWGYSCLTMIDRETIGIMYESSVAHMAFQAIPLKDLIK